MPNFISIVFLLLLVAGVYTLVIMVSRSGKSALTSFAERSKLVQTDKRKRTLVPAGGITVYLPKAVLREAKQYEWNLTKEMYWGMVLGAGVTAGALGGFFYDHHPISLVLYLSGFLLPRLLVYYRKRKFRMMTVERLSAYMKGVANSLHVTQNIPDVMEEIKPLMPESIQQEISKALILLQGGTRVNRAFESFNKTFPFREVEFFHEMLDLLQREGGGNALQTLMDVSNDFEQQKVLLARLQTSLVQARRAFLQNVVIVLGMPFAMMLLSPQAKGYLAGTFVGKAAMTGTIIVIVLVARKVEQIAAYNPMERREA